MSQKILNTIFEFNIEAIKKRSIDITYKLILISFVNGYQEKDTIILQNLVLMKVLIILAL